MSLLLEPYTLRQLTLINRIAVSPMCQYSSVDGLANDWHLVHLGSRAVGGAGLIFTEATAVTPDGRITAQDLGLWHDDQIEPLQRITRFIRAQGAVAGIQLAHAGRKASTLKPWEGGGGPIPADDARGWTTRAPSALPYAETDPVPEALDDAGIAEIIQAFTDSAIRAVRLGLDLIEIHAAHGYLLHEFVSPLSNQRSDAYGGSLENRMRLVLQVFDAIKAVVPESMALGIRISATDWVEGGWDVEQSIALAKALDARGCHFIHVSSGGLHPAQKIAAGPGYQLPFAEAIKREVAMPVIAVGMITEPRQAEAVLVDGQADAVALARAMLFDPRWPWRAAAELGAQVAAPPQYLRSAPHGHSNLFVQATGSAG